MAEPSNIYVFTICTKAAKNAVKKLSDSFDEAGIEMDAEMESILVSWLQTILTLAEGTTTSSETIH